MYETIESLRVPFRDCFGAGWISYRRRTIMGACDFSWGRRWLSEESR